MTDAELSALSDQQLSERVALELAGWKKPKKNNPLQGSIQTCRSDDYYWTDPEGQQWTAPGFATSADAVLRLCVMFSQFEIKKYSSSAEYSVRLRGVGARSHWYTIAVGRAPTLARACCLALLLAKGAA